MIEMASQIIDIFAPSKYNLDMYKINNGPICNKLIFAENVHDQTLDKHRDKFTIVKGDDSCLNKYCRDLMTQHYLTEEILIQ